MMRRLSILIATSALLVIVAAPAQAAVTESLTGVSVKPANAGTKQFPAKSNLLLTASIAESTGAKLPVTDRLILDFDKNIQLMGKYFPSCSADKLTAGQQADLPACRKAKIGTAQASAKFYQPSGALAGQVSFSTNIYNGPGGRSEIAYVVVPGTSVQAAMVGAITHPRGTYGSRVSFVIPPALKQPLPGVFTSLEKFQVTKLQATTATKKNIKVGKRIIKRKVGYLETTGCTGGSFKVRVAFDFTPPAPTVSQAATTPCTK